MPKECIRVKRKKVHKIKSKGIKTEYKQLAKEVIKIAEELQYVYEAKSLVYALKKVVKDNPMNALEKRLIWLEVLSILE